MAFHTHISKPQAPEFNHVAIRKASAAYCDWHAFMFTPTERNERSRTVGEAVETARVYIKSKNNVGPVNTAIIDELDLKLNQKITLVQMNYLVSKMVDSTEFVRGQQTRAVEA